MPEVSWSGFAEARSAGENAESRHHRPCIAEEGEINCALFYIATIFLKDPAIQYAGVSDGCGGDGGERNLGELCGWGGRWFYTRICGLCESCDDSRHSKQPARQCVLQACLVMREERPEVVDHG